MIKSKDIGYLPTKAMYSFWDLHKRTGFTPFSWFGDMFEDSFEHEYSEDILERIASYTEALRTGRIGSRKILDVNDLEELFAEPVQKMHTLPEAL